MKMRSQKSKRRRINCIMIKITKNAYFLKCVDSIKFWKSYQTDFHQEQLELI